MDASISALVNLRLNDLKNLCARIGKKDCLDVRVPGSSGWQDELGRLRLWAANIGAHQTGQSSLEFRLKDASHIRKQIVQLLQDLGAMVQDVKEALSELDSPKEQDISSEDDYDPAREICQSHCNIVTVITCLFQMSILVRKPARHDFLALPQSQVIAAFKPFDQNHVREKYPEADEKLVERLGLAMTRRRQYLRYRERHHAKFGKGLEPASEAGETSTLALSDTIFTDMGSRHRDPQVSPPASEISQTSYAPSMLDGEGSGIPPPPRESRGGAPFECPYCFLIIAIGGPHAWHKHIFQDLQPYICTVLSCSTPHTLYPTRRQWVRHLKDAHSTEWMSNCTQIAAPMTDGSEHPKICATCPLCEAESNSEKHFVRHLARHLQELACFVLPRTDADSDVDGSNTSSKPMVPDESDAESSDVSTNSAEPNLEKAHDAHQTPDSIAMRLLRDNRDRDERSKDPGPRQELSRTSRSSRRKSGKFFIHGEGINREVLQREISKILGPEASSGPRTYNGIQGYVITAPSPLTPIQLEHLQKLSKKRISEVHESPTHAEDKTRGSASGLDQAVHTVGKPLGKTPRRDIWELLSLPP